MVLKVNSLFLVAYNTFMVFYIFHSFYKNCLIHRLRKTCFFRKQTFSFFLALYLYQFMVLATLLRIRWHYPIFSIKIRDLMLVLNFLRLYRIFIILGCFSSWLHVFQSFQFSSLLVKIVDHYEVHTILGKLNISLNEISYITIFIRFFFKFSLNLNLYST